MFPIPNDRPARCRARLAGTLVLAALCACRGTPFPSEVRLAPRPAAVPEAPTLGPNDVLRVRVHGYPELSTPEGPGAVGTRVDLEGRLSLPLVGAVEVAGRTPSEARAAVAAAFARYVEDPKVDLSVVSHGARRFYVLGEVERPGPYVIDRPLTVLQALSHGGAFARFARRDAVALLRREGERVLVRRVDATRADPEGFLPIRPDDVLLVLRTGAGEFSDEVLPYVTAASQALGTAASFVLIEDRLD